MLHALVAALSLGLATARRHPYPAGVCTPSTSSACFSACDAATCGGGKNDAECGLLAYPQVARGDKNKTKCLPFYNSTCADPAADQAGCNRCSLWSVMQSGKCADSGNATTCELRGWYAVMAAQEKDKEEVNALCATKGHWLVLPTHACTGIESDDPECTGPPAERLWWAASVVMADKGFAANGTRRFGALLNSPPWRGQHQEHIHVAYLKEDAPKARVIPLYLNRTQFSTDAGRPTVLTEDDNTAMATVFVEGGLQGDGAGGKIAPFAVGADVAAKAQPEVPYGLFVEPFRQRGRRRGWLISAVYDWSDKEGLETGGTDECLPACAPF